MAVQYRFRKAGQLGLKSKMTGARSNESLGESSVREYGKCSHPSEGRTRPNPIAQTSTDSLKSALLALGDKKTYPAFVDTRSRQRLDMSLDSKYSDIEYELFKDQPGSQIFGKILQSVSARSSSRLLYPYSHISSIFKHVLQILLENALRHFSLIPPQMQKPE